MTNPNTDHEALITAIVTAVTDAIRTALTDDRSPALDKAKNLANAIENEYSDLSATAESIHRLASDLEAEVSNLVYQTQRSDTSDDAYSLVSELTPNSNASSS